MPPKQQPSAQQGGLFPQNAGITNNQQNFADVPVNSLETLRTTLAQLNRSISLYEDSIRQSTGAQKTGVMPSWTYLQNQYNVILSQLTSLASSLDANRDILTHTNVYPNTEFPATLNEGLLTTMLRKKHLPEVIEWIQESIRSNDEFKAKNPAMGGESEFDIKCLQDSQNLLEDYNFGGYLTRKEEEEGIELGKEFDSVGGGSDNNLLSASNSSNSKSSPDGLSVNEIYRFIYQGTNSKIL